MSHGMAHDVIRRWWGRGPSVPPPRVAQAVDVEPGDVVVLAPRGWDGSERHVHHARHVIRTGDQLRFIDDLGLGVSVPPADRVLVTAPVQRVFWLQKLSRAAVALAREVDRGGGTLASLVIGIHQLPDDPATVELTTWSEIVMVGVADRHRRPVIDLRRDWLLLRDLEIARAPITTVLAQNRGIGSAVDAARLGKAVRRKAQGYLMPPSS